jgi:hypothetical protein
MRKPRTNSSQRMRPFDGSLSAEVAQLRKEQSARQRMNDLRRAIELSKSPSYLTQMHGIVAVPHACAPQGPCAFYSTANHYETGTYFSGCARVSIHSSAPYSSTDDIPSSQIVPFAHGCHFHSSLLCPPYVDFDPTASWRYTSHMHLYERHALRSTSVTSHLETSGSLLTQLPDGWNEHMEQIWQAQEVIKTAERVHVCTEAQVAIELAMKEAQTVKSRVKQSLPPLNVSQAPMTAKIITCTSPVVTTSRARVVDGGCKTLSAVQDAPTERVQQGNSVESSLMATTTATSATTTADVEGDVLQLLADAASSAQMTRRCVKCHTTETPKWRGQDCNRCGLRATKRRKTRIDEMHLLADAASSAQIVVRKGRDRGHNEIA